MRVFIFSFIVCVVCNAQSGDSLADRISYLDKALKLEIEGQKQVSKANDTLMLKLHSLTTNGLRVGEIEIVVEQVRGGQLVNLPRKIRTDSNGFAQLAIFGFAAKSNYAILFQIQGQQQNNSLYEVEVKNSQWVFLMVVGLLGGLSLFLLGMNMMSSGMQNSAGDRLRNILDKLTHNRFVAVGVGALITTIIQSSSATNVMLVSFVNSKLLRFKQTIGIILGAAIGTTITAQIIAFKITDYALLFVTIGLSLHFMAKKNSLRESGKAMLGFGILFFGMHIMSDSMYPLRTYQPFLDAITHLENPVLGILAGVVFTALIQSSSAFIGILIILAMQGMLSLEASLSLVIGANIGTAVTALLASINTSREAKQVAIAHTLIKIVGAVLFIPLMPFFIQTVEYLANNSLPEATPREIANAHTIYNIVLCALILPFTNSVAWFVNRLFPVLPDEEETVAVKYIEPNLLEAPLLALNAARSETIQMMEEVRNMARLIITPFLEKNLDLTVKIGVSEERVNFLRDAITSFLVELTRKDVSEATVEEAFINLNAVREYEEIADVISTQLINKAHSWCNNDFTFSDEGKQELIKYHKQTIKILNKSITAFKDLNIKQARKLKDKYYVYRNEYFELERNHYERLQSNNEKTIESSKTHLELITLLKVICSHATNTSRIILREEPKQKRKKKKGNE